MPYLLKSGSLTIVARSLSDALKLRARFLEDDSNDVVIADMDGQPLDASELEDLDGATD